MTPWLTDALGRSTSVEYNSANQVVAVTDRKGQRVSFSHDERGRVVSITLPDRTISRSFDALGRVTEMGDNASTHAWRYDEAGRIIQVDTTTAAGSHRLVYAYDSLDRVTQRTLSGTGIAQPEVTTYAWDLENRITGHASRVGPEGAITEHQSSYTYDAASRLTQRSSQITASGTAQPSLTQRYHYDALDRMSRIEYVQNAGQAGEQLLEQIDYGYDARGLITSKTTLNNHGTGVNETPMEATYDSANRMQSITLRPSADASTHRTYNLSFDANGNLTEKVNAADSNERTTYTWDALNRLTGLSRTQDGQTTVASYQFDLYGRRIQSSIQEGSNPAQTVQYVYDGQSLLGEMRGGQLSHRLIGGLSIDENIARLAMTPAGVVDLAHSRQMLTDAISSTLAQTNAQGGGLANSYGYSPYGETSAIGPDATDNTAQYTGRENDAQGATGLYFYRTRFYDPVLKRFISEDPIGLAGGSNVYAYVNGNPVSFNDPTGLVYRKGNNFSQIPPPGPGCQKAVWGGGYIYGWKPCDTPPDTPPMQCKADPLPFNPPENPEPAPPPPPPGQPEADPSNSPSPWFPPSTCDILPFGFCIESTGQVRHPKYPIGCVHKAGEGGNYTGCGLVSNTGFSMGASRPIIGNSGAGGACVGSVSLPFGAGVDAWLQNGGRSSVDMGFGFGNAGPSFTCGVRN